MSDLEIPLLREAPAFSARLQEAARRLGDSRHRWQRRVNWSYRYERRFYAAEAACFRAAPDDYLAGRAAPPAALDDVFAERLRPRQFVVAAAKVLAHWSFALAGRLFGTRAAPDAAALPIYRKCYVDDIELVFDPDEHGVLRAVYPFPINLKRQRRYLRTLRERGRPHRLAGLPYRARDLLRLLWRRDVASLMRLESRAQTLHAARLLAEGFERFDLSDEFEIGSLDFARRLARAPVHVVNSAHGVGKYFPVHAYPEFRVVTLRQQDYYHAARGCRYSLRRLNVQAALGRGGAAAEAGPQAARVRFVLLGQTFKGGSPIVEENEAALVARLHEAFAGRADLALLYKPHPNSERPGAPEGFGRLDRIDAVNGLAGTVYASFFSTCQVDPLFQGRKVLVRGRLIHPEIAFDDSEEIVDADGLAALLRSMLDPSEPVPTPAHRSAGLQPARMS